MQTEVLFRWLLAGLVLSVAACAASDAPPQTESESGAADASQTQPSDADQVRDDALRTDPQVAGEASGQRVRRESTATPLAREAHAQLFKFADRAASVRPGLSVAPPVMPAPVDREGYDAIAENRFRSVALSPLSTFGLDVDTASYSNVRRFLTQGQLPPPDAVRVEELINYFDYDYPQPSGRHPLAVRTEVATAPWNPSHRLVMVGVKARELSAADAVPNRLVFLLDTSGSMNNPAKLPLLKRAFGELVGHLRPQDQVAIVAYAGSAGLVLPSTPGSEKAALNAALERLQAGGSTAGAQGIELAYQVARQQFVAGANNRVILATDGDFNVGMSSDGELVRLIEKRRDDGIFLTVLGLGTGNYQDAKMQKLAGHGNGTHHYLDSDREARRVFGEKLLGTLYTVAKDVKIQIEWNPATVGQYRLIGYENRVLAAEDFRDDRKDSGDVGAGHTVTALYEIVPPDGRDSQPPRYGRQARESGPAGELGQVSVRYKMPAASTGIEFAQLIANQGRPLETASAALRWASAVAEFGLLLGDSAHRGAADFGRLIARAEAVDARGRDPLRGEFIELARRAATLSTPQARAHSPWPVD